MEVCFYPRKQKEGKILAFADVVVADGITVRGFRVVDGDKGLFAAVPSRSFTVDGKPRFANQVVFATQEIRDRFLSELLESYYQWQQAEGSAEGAIESGMNEEENHADSEPPF
jgi:DNA-binding cell septation regulator SpoVG